MSEGIAILRKINKLDKLQVSSQIYNQDKYDPEGVGIPDGLYKGHTLLGSKRNVTPVYDSLKERWAFDGTLQDLKSIQDKLKLRDKDGTLITIEEDSLTNRYDKFWGHPSLYVSKIMEEGSTSLNPATPLEDLLLRVQRGNSFVKGSSDNQSQYIIADSNLELISPRKEVEMASKAVDKQMKATILLSEMGQRKMNAIAYLMDLPGYVANDTDEERLKTLLFHQCVTNTSKYHKGTNMTFQDRFIQLAETSDSELNIMQKIMTAKIRGAIRGNASTGFTFKGEKLNDGNVKSEIALMNFFLDANNYEKYKELELFLEETEEVFNKL